MRNRLLPWLLVVATLLFVGAVWLDLTPWLRGPDEWRWPLRPLLAVSIKLVVPIAALGIYLAACSRWLSVFDRADGVTRVTERRFILFLIAATPLIQLCLAVAVYRNPFFHFFSATVAPSVTGYYSVAITEPDLPAQFPHYAAYMQTLPIHPQTHPPGLVLIHWLGWQLFKAMPGVSSAIAAPLRGLQCHNVALMALDDPQLASSITGMLVPAMGGLAVWPLYAFGKHLAGPRVAAMTAMLFPILPGFAMWSGQWDQVYPLLLFAALHLTHTGLASRSARRLFAAGVALSIGTFLSAGNAVLIAIVGLYGLMWFIKNASPRRPRPALRMAFAFALGCLSVWALYMGVYGVSLSEVIEVGSRLASEATRCPICPSTTRSYSVWVVWNVVDVATFLSVPLTLLFVARLPAAMAAIRAFLKGDAPHGPAPLAIAALATFIALDASGIVRGEVGRMWQYFSPLFVLIAYASAAPAPGKKEQMLVMGLVALQLFTLNTRWLVTPSFLDEPPERQANFTAPDPHFAQRISFERQIALVGYDVKLAKGPEPAQNFVDLTLHWQTLAQPPHAYTVFTHVVDGEGRLVGQQDNMPLRDQLPTSCWQPGEFVADPYAIPLSAQFSRPLTLEVGLYRLDTGERLSLDDGSGTSARLSLP